MNVLLIGSGGREHTLAWKLGQSKKLKGLFNLPGNPGTAQHGQNLPGNPVDLDCLVSTARQVEADLVVIGPEVPLAAGAADSLRQAGFAVFGPGAGAAQIESSKAFSKVFMERHGLPSASFKVFDQFEAATSYASGLQPESIVLKASGLAAGKGVYLPSDKAEVDATLRSLLVEQRLGEAGREVIIEERLQGREVSVLAFCDGRDLLVMPPVQDHKTLLEGGMGPNTGGMGTFAPSPHCPPPLLDQVREEILQKTVDGLREEGLPFSGVLYAGLILTTDGPRLLEFNCRFGDPETQVILPLLDSDLLDILEACAYGKLKEVAGSVRWNPGAAVCVVLSAAGYPDTPQTGQVIQGLQNLPAEAWAFHAGTRLKNGDLTTAGGRVLGVTATGIDLAQAVDRAYQAVEKITFTGMHYRRDIGRSEEAVPAGPKGSYEAAGVSLAVGNRAVSLIKEHVRATFTPGVLSDVGAFGGLFSLAELKDMQDPVLAASTDGVGTKVDLAARAGRFAGLGEDIVNHCINDILVQGARPLFFLDYFAASKLIPEQIAEILRGMSKACREAGCALLGGETAEMPGVYAQGRFDVAGTIVGVVERSAILPQMGIKPGDVLLGLESSGPHTNGYSLIRQIFADTPLDKVFPELGIPLAEALLAPHRSYLGWLNGLLFGESPGIVKALAHLTGGGFYDNIPRVLPPGCGARLDSSAWDAPPVFELIERLGDVERREMYQVFNMGIGMVVFVDKSNVQQALASLPGPAWVMGEVIAGEGVQID
jgi:phosphoribosylamine--glycine ligase / phosphoribosylformylglycinamidine cyclo-ligase